MIHLGQEKKSYMVSINKMFTLWSFLPVCFLISNFEDRILYNTFIVVFTSKNDSIKLLFKRFLKFIAWIYVS